jgi:hypothetical protein
VTPVKPVQGHLQTIVAKNKDDAERLKKLVQERGGVCIGEGEHVEVRTEG